VMKYFIVPKPLSDQVQQFNELDLGVYACKLQHKVEADILDQGDNTYKFKLPFSFSQSTIDKHQYEYTSPSAEVFIDCFYDTINHELSKSGYWFKCRSWLDAERCSKHQWSLTYANNTGSSLQYHRIQGDAMQALSVKFPNLMQQLSPLVSMRVFRYNVQINSHTSMQLETYTYDNFQTFHSLGCLVFDDAELLEGIVLHDITIPVRPRLTQTLIAAEPELYSKMIQGMEPPETNQFYYSDPITYNFFGESREDYKAFRNRAYDWCNRSNVTNSQLYAYSSYVMESIELDQDGDTLLDFKQDLHFL